MVAQTKVVNSFNPFFFFLSLSLVLTQDDGGLLDGRWNPDRARLSCAGVRAEGAKR